MEARAASFLKAKFGVPLPGCPLLASRGESLVVALGRRWACMRYFKLGALTLNKGYEYPPPPPRPRAAE